MARARALITPRTFSPARSRDGGAEWRAAIAHLRDLLLQVLQDAGARALEDQDEEEDRAEEADRHVHPEPDPREALLRAALPGPEPAVFGC
jgi:hypothetical protein